MIGMVLVWKIRDTYRAVFDIDSASSANGTFNMRALESFVSIQSDAALREVTGRFAYDTTDSSSDELTLRGGGEEINELLEHKINERRHASPPAGNGYHLRQGKNRGGSCKHGRDGP